LRFGTRLQLGELISIKGMAGAAEYAKNYAAVLRHFLQQQIGKDLWPNKS